jgi:hypothetical protein
MRTYMMRRVFPVLILAILTAVGCSRQSPPHIGEWDAELYKGAVLLDRSTFYFSEDGIAQMIFTKPTPKVIEGRYKFDYSKNPIQLDINWSDNLVMLGIVRFIGEDKNRLQIIYTWGDDPKRPANFEVNQPIWWLTKKVKK